MLSSLIPVDGEASFGLLLSHLLGVSLTCGLLACYFGCLSGLFCGLTLSYLLGVVLYSLVDQDTGYDRAQHGGCYSI